MPHVVWRREGRKNWKRANHLGRENKKRRRETETDKFLPHAHYVICVISYKQRQLTWHILNMPLPVLNTNQWLHLLVWDWHTAYFRAGGLKVCGFCTPGLASYFSKLKTFPVTGCMLLPCIQQTCVSSLHWTQENNRWEVLKENITNQKCHPHFQKSDKLK